MLTLPILEAVLTDIEKSNGRGGENNCHRYRRAKDLDDI